MCSILHRGSPGKGPVTGYQNAGAGKRVALADGLYNHPASVRLVFRFDFIASHKTRARNRPVEIVGVCGAQSGNGPAGLGPRRGSKAVCVHNSAYTWEGSIQLE